MNNIKIEKYKENNTDIILDEARELKIIKSDDVYIITFMAYIVTTTHTYKWAFDKFLMILKTLSLLTLPIEFNNMLKQLNYPNFSFEVNDKTEELKFMIEI